MLALPEVRERLRALGAEAAPSTPEAFDRFIAAQLRTVTQLAQKAGIQQQ